LGIGKADLDLGIAGAQRLGDARQRSPRAHRADKAVDAAIGLGPDFRPRGFGMGTAIGHIVELVGPDGAIGQFGVELFRQPPRYLDVVVGVLVGLGRDLDQLGAVKAQRILLFLALGLWDDDYRFETERIGYQRQPDAGIARRAFDDGAAGLQPAGLDRVVDDEERRSVLDRLARIEEFGLAPDFASGERGDAVEADQRRVADGGDEVFVLGHGFLMSKDQALIVGAGRGARKA